MKDSLAKSQNSLRASLAKLQQIGSFSEALKCGFPMGSVVFEATGGKFSQRLRRQRVVVGLLRGGENRLFLSLKLTARPLKNDVSDAEKKGIRIDIFTKEKYQK